MNEDKNQGKSKFHHHPQSKEFIMHSIKVFLTGLAAVSVCMAAIRGTVLDTSGVAIPGAVVQLESGGQPVTTDANGNFTITASTAVNRISQPLVHNFCTIQGGLLRITVAKRGVVEITAYDLCGKIRSSVQQTMEAGTNSYALPHTGAGIYLYRVKADGNEIVLKGSSIGGSFQSGYVATALSMTKTNLTKQSKAAAAINDVIAVTKSGYLNYRSVIYNSDTSEIAILMIASAGTVMDADGNVYQTVKIGNQVWMTENLRVTKYNDGSDIPHVTDSAAWVNLTTPAYCFYNNTTDSVSIKKYGALYNWYVVNPQNPKKIAPTGWHVPTDSEWTAMEKYLVLNGYNWGGTTDTTHYNEIAKSLAAKADWFEWTTTGSIGRDLTKNNRSGFSALPGGWRDYGGFDFDAQSFYGCWWSATTVGDASIAWNRVLCYGNADLNRNTYEKSCGFSVRLVKD